MASVAIILGGLAGTFSAALGWLVFGLGIADAVQLYFAVGLCLACGLILAATLRRPVRQLATQDAPKPA